MRSTDTGAGPFAELPPEAQPAWLRQLFQVVRVYPPEGPGEDGAAVCRWCDLTWPLPLARYARDAPARAAWVLVVARHGVQHAVNGELRLDAHGRPLDAASPGGATGGPRP